ncbi:MAG: SDH family Clp fold serine proteinase [Candidatus Aminicenantaceae bacterium]
MGIYSEYLDRSFNFPDLSKERKKQLKRISEIRNNRNIFTIAAALTKRAAISIDYDDLLPISDQLSNLKDDKIDIILETPGGSAEIAEDIVKLVRNKFSEVAMIVPGYAKSAGTIMVMAGDEILMEPVSALGPIDAQIFQGNRRFSAHAFLDGLKKIKKEVNNTGSLNHAYIPMLQNISPGDIQNCENLKKFSERLVTNWLTNFKFKFWYKHSSTGKDVTEKEKKQRAKEIAEILCNHRRWLTHERSIKIEDLVNEMHLKVTDYSKNPELYEAISRYYTLLKMTFDTTNIFKLFETPESQIYRFTKPPAPSIQRFRNTNFFLVGTSDIN